MAPPRWGAAGTEIRTERALGVTRGLWKVTPDGEGLGSRGPLVWGPLVGGRPVLGTFRCVREWERSRLRGCGESNPSVDNFWESAATLSSVFEGPAG